METTSSKVRAEDKKRTRVKKPNPLLVLLQKGLYSARRTEYLRQKSAETVPDGSHVITCDDVSPVSSPDTCWVDTISGLNNRRPSCGSSRCLSCNSESVDTCPIGSSVNTCHSTGSNWSSSWTSWTQPHCGGNKISMDSCQPNTSIFDNDDVFNSSHKSREGRKLIRMDSKLFRRRDSSADTCKDIDDIEDLELDDDDEEDETCQFIENEEDVDITNCDSDGIKDKRLSGFMSSPDLAYCSMDGCG